MPQASATRCTDFFTTRGAVWFLGKGLGGSELFLPVNHPVVYSPIVQGPGDGIALHQQFPNSLIVRFPAIFPGPDHDSTFLTRTVDYTTRATRGQAMSASLLSFRLSPGSRDRAVAKSLVLSLEKSCRALSREVVPVLTLGSSLLSLSETTDFGQGGQL